MKKLFWLAAFTLVGIYGSGYASLGEGGVNRFLNHSEELTMDGNAHAICDLMHEDMTVSLDDRSTGRALKFQGGKEEFCEYTKNTVPGLRLVVSSMTTTRENLNVEREWLHPWTAEVAYTEHRSMSMQRVGMQIDTQSEDKMTLVKTFGGVKIKRLESTVWKAP